MIEKQEKLLKVLQDMENECRGARRTLEIWDAGLVDSTQIFKDLKQRLNDLFEAIDSCLEAVRSIE